MPKPKKNTPDPGNVGPESGSGSGSGTSASKFGQTEPDEQTEQTEQTWTRGDDPAAAADALRQANQGSTGGELNTPVPKTTPKGNG